MSRLHAQWTEQLDSLTRLYLSIKTANPTHAPVHYLEPLPDSNHVEIWCIDIFGELYYIVSIVHPYFYLADGRSREYIPWGGTDNHVHALLHAGYLPPTPTDPQVAFSLRTLDLLHSLFRVASNFGIQSFSRLLTDMHKVYISFVISFSFAHVEH
jgi:hypothetical protein